MILINITTIDNTQYTSTTVINANKHNIITVRKDVLSMFLKVDKVGAARDMFQATAPATQNARLTSCSLALGTTKSPRAVL